ncbi:hypothetical protein, partial [Mycobacterium marinum]|uniref:hypothetical protein n=1 Tax=Mycobacterium marinum TaxID=1781 RepID=UPI0021C38A2E
GPQFLIDTTNTGWILLSGQNWIPLLGHQWVLFHGHGHGFTHYTIPEPHVAAFAPVITVLGDLN